MLFVVTCRDQITEGFEENMKMVGTFNLELSCSVSLGVREGLNIDNSVDQRSPAGNALE